jgi:hypothetical protein
MKNLNGESGFGNRQSKGASYATIPYFRFPIPFSEGDL